MVIGPLVVGGLGGALVAWTVTMPAVRLTLPVAMWGLAAFVGYHMIQTFDWVEFDGHLLRARHLYTRRLWVYPVAEVRAVWPLYAAARGHVVNAVTDQIMGPVRGYEIRVARRCRGIWMAAGDTANATELARAVADAIGQPLGTAAAAPRRRRSDNGSNARPSRG